MPSLSYLTLYKYVSMAALLISNSLFLFRLQRKPRFALRLALCARLIPTVSRRDGMPSAIAEGKKRGVRKPATTPKLRSAAPPCAGTALPRAP